MTSAEADAPGAGASMRRAVVQPGSGVRLEEAPVPSPVAGEALVRSTLVGICGSDTHALAGRHPFLPSAYVPGHEATGVVARLGPGTRGLAVGQRVVLKPNLACGACTNCASGRSNACETLAWVGCDPAHPGAMADCFVAPVGNLYAVPDGVDDATAALVECLATPLHAARIAGDLSAACVVVLGAGTIGLLCVVAALQAGAAAVAVTDLVPAKVDRAVRVGAIGGVRAGGEDVERQVRELLGGPADVVFDCVANERSLAEGVGMLRRAGSLLVVGVPPGPATVPLPLVQDRELRLQGSAAYTEADLVAAVETAAAGGIPVGEIVSATFALDRVVEAFAEAAADSSGKVFVTPGALTATR